MYSISYISLSHNSSIYTLLTFVMLDCILLISSTRSETHLQNLDQMENYLIEGVENVISSKHLRQFNLMGHSLGGYIASLYAERHPEQVIST